MDSTDIPGNKPGLTQVDRNIPANSRSGIDARADFKILIKPDS
jgi:hypothetical protein